MIESIEKLRDKSYIPGYRGEKTLEMLADEIEAEIAERYMLLPVDADGVPIHVGDVMTLRHGKTCEVVAVSDSQFTANKMGCEKVVCHANLHRHVKPRTIEDVLADFASKQHGITKEENDALIAECADVIRELTEVDA